MCVGFWGILKVWNVNYFIIGDLGGVGNVRNLIWIFIYVVVCYN